MDVLELAMETRQYDVGMVLINYYAINYERGRVDQAHAAVNDDIDYLQMCFSDLQSESATDNLYHRNPLYWAAAFGQVQACSLLRHNKHWINDRDYRRKTPLYVCVYGNTDEHVECARLLLQKEARMYFAQPDYYGKQPGDYADYPPMMAMLKEYVQITLCMDYSYPSKVIGIQDISSYLDLATVCAELTESQRDPKHMILQATPTAL